MLWTDRHGRVRGRGPTCGKTPITLVGLWCWKRYCIPTFDKACKTLTVKVKLYFCLHSVDFKTDVQPHTSPILDRGFPVSGKFCLPKTKGPPFENKVHGGGAPGPLQRQSNFLKEVSKCYKSGPKWHNTCAPQCGAPCGGTTWQRSGATGPPLQIFRQRVCLVEHF